MSGFEYAQARLQARYGARADAATWARLHGVRSFPALLEAARQTPLKHWVHPLHAEDDAHAVELALRRQWRSLIAEVAAWLPQEWRTAADWCGPLCDLPAVAYLLRGEPVIPWMRSDPAIKAYALEDMAARRGALLASPLSALAAAFEAATPLRAAWLAEWRKRWPHRDAALEQLASRLESHLRDAAAGALQHRLQAVFRRHAAQPAAAFAFLALTALDLEQLRAELAVRLLFPRAKTA